jgi:hypothetical protein
MVSVHCRKRFDPVGHGRAPVKPHLAQRKLPRNKYRADVGISVARCSCPTLLAFSNAAQRAGHSQPASVESIRRGRSHCVARKGHCSRESAYLSVAFSIFHPEFLRNYSQRPSQLGRVSTVNLGRLTFCAVFSGTPVTAMNWLTWFRCAGVNGGMLSHLPGSGLFVGRIDIRCRLRLEGQLKLELGYQ